MPGETVVVGTQSPLGCLHLTLASWNSRALFTSHHSLQHRAIRKLQIYKQLCTQHIVSTAQETHGNSTDLATLYREIPSHEHYLSTLPSAAGGVCVSIKKSFFKEHFSRHHLFEVIAGRAVGLRAYGPAGNLCVVAAHVVPELSDLDLRALLDDIGAVFVQSADTVNILIGDVMLTVIQSMNPDSL